MKGNNREALLFTSPRPSNISIDLQMNLLNTWTRHKIPDNYQNLFLAYLDEQPVDIAETEMKKQVKQTIEKSTLLFKVQTLEDQRGKQLGTLEDLLSNSNTPMTSDELTVICEQVKTLRTINLQLAEALIKMYDSLKCQKSDSIYKQTCFFGPYLERLNSQNKLIRESVLGKYINFGSGYDPFLMDYYEQFHRNHGQNTEVSIKELFQLNISLVYRLLKAKNTLLEMKSKMKPEQKVSQSIAYLKSSYRQVGKVKNYRQRGYFLEQVRKPIKTETLPSRKDYSLEKVTPIKIAPIQVFPARTTIYSPHRLNSPSNTDGPSYELMQSRINQRKLDPIENEKSTNNRRRSNRVYLQTESSDYQTLYNSFQLNQSNRGHQDHLDSYRRDEHYTKPHIPKLRPYKLTPITYKPEGQNQSMISHHSQSIISSQQIQRKQLEKMKNNDSKQKRQEPQNPHPQNYLQNKLKQFKTLAAADYQVKNYNPIKKNQYELIKKTDKTSKYDYVPITNAQLSDGDEQGLDIQTPIYKYNKKNPAYKKSAACPSLIDQLTLPKKISKNSQKIAGQPQKQPPQQRPQQQNLSKNEKQREKSAISSSEQGNKVNQQCQTIQSHQVIIQKAAERQKNQQRQRRNSQTSKQENEKPMKEQAPNKALSNNPAPVQKKSDQKVPVQTKPDMNNLDQTLENEDIVDYRPAQKTNRNESLIKTVPKEKDANQNQNQNENSINPKANASPNIVQNRPPSQYPKANESNVIISTKQSQKKEIKMKVGKSTLSELFTLLQSSPISPQTKALFSFDKLSQWLKVGQTYLLQFHVNNECAVIALCSPIPNIGMALKLWAPIHPSIDSAASNNLFLKYIEFIQKSTTVEKILFSGNGQAFKELKAAQFVQKKQNLYERGRKLPPKNIQFEFKPFLYVECSSVAFNQAENGSLLFSQEIQQFSPTNHYCSNILSDNNPSNVPKPLLPFIKITQNVKDFAQVNKILTAEQFDNYEAGEVKASSINILRLFANTPFKSSFIANDGYLQFVGILLYQKQKECLISIPTSKYNGVMYFAKNMDLKSMIDKCKIASGNNKVKFNIKMFHKVLYGKLLNRPKGSYGNWEVNLTWQDQMQGKVKHPLPQGRSFGPEPFFFGIEIEKELLLCAEVNKDDFIY